MKVLLNTLRFLYLILPPVVIIYLAQKLDKPMILVGIIFCYSGSLSKIYNYKGVPIFYVIMWCYLQYLGFSMYSVYSFFGVCLFWGYFLAGWAQKCKQIIITRGIEERYQYN